MTVFRFRVTDKNPAHTRVNLFVGPDADHLGLAGGLTFRNDEFGAFADAITDYNERAEAVLVDGCDDLACRAVCGNCRPG